MASVRRASGNFARDSDVLPASGSPSATSHMEQMLSAISPLAFSWLCTFALLRMPPAGGGKTNHALGAAPTTDAGCGVPERKNP